MALTFDDLPRPASDAPGLDRLAIHREVLAALAKHRVPPSYGFLNAGVLSQHPEDRAADIDRNEAALRALGGPERDWKVFRFPFLQEGIDAASRTAIREHLYAGGYRIAEVTVDFGDWAFGGPYGRCLAEGNGEAVAALRKTYLVLAESFLDWSVAAAREIHGRPIRHVALLHITAFTARMLDELLAAWERRGVRFITLDQAQEVLCRNEVHR